MQGSGSGMELFGSMTRSRYCLSRIPFDSLPHRSVPNTNNLFVMFHIVSGIFYPMRYSGSYLGSFDPMYWMVQMEWYLPDTTVCYASNVYPAVVVAEYSIVYSISICIVIRRKGRMIQTLLLVTLTLLYPLLELYIAALNSRMG